MSTTTALASVDTGEAYSRALYLNSDLFSLSAAARALGANVSAVERRSQRAIRKLCTYYEAAAAA
jgi:DNA-directed RNA polymerase specialized sigma24 family protein